MIDVDSMALSAAKEVEDIFCRHFPGGRAQRLAALQVAIAQAMNAMWDRRIEAIKHLTVHEYSAIKSHED